MKIAVVVTSLSNCGPTNVALKIVESLSNRFSVTIIALSGGSNLDSFKLVTDRVVIFNGNRILSTLKAISFIKEEQFDLVHSHCFFPDIANWLSRNKVTISTIHNYYFRDYIDSYGVIKGACLSVLHILVSRQLKHNIACSESLSLYLTNNKFVGSKSIQNGVDFSSTISSSDDVREPEGKIKFIYVGVLNKRKNVAESIEWFLNRYEFGEAELTIAGDGEYYSELTYTYSHHSHIKFLGFVSETRQLLAQNDVYLSMSKAEGLPLAVLEAMSEGLTYVLSDIEPHKEIDNSSDLKTGKVIGPTTVIHRQNFEDDLIHLKRNSYTVFKQCFSSKRMSQRYEEVYLESAKVVEIDKPDCY
jgi:glycosyltransferase involved in cell wall biosynthesis